MSHIHSKIAYSQIADSLSTARSSVYRAVLAQGSISRQGVADALGWPINRVTGRISELLQTGQIVEDGVQYVDGRPRALLTINPEFGVAA